MQASTSSIGSTPSKPRSKQAHTNSTPPPSRPQSELVKIISDEIDDQTYEFEPEVVARMLSPKLLRKNAPNISHPALSDFECLIDDPAVRAAMRRLPSQEYRSWVAPEKPNYAPMAEFLNKCVEECNKVYDVIHQTLPRNSRFKVAERTSRWLAELCFVKFDSRTKDGIQHSEPLKPDIVGINGLDATTQDISCWWNLPPEENSPASYQIMIPMEIKSSWSDMVAQAGTYARGLFAASPLRTFALVIAANQVQQDFRFLIFHHGGLSVSKAIKLDNAGCIALQKMLLSVLLWQSAEDAGLPTFTDGKSFLFPDKPEPLNIGGVWNIKHVIHHFLSTRGRNTYVVSLESKKSDVHADVKTTVKPKRKSRRYLKRAQRPDTASTAPLTSTQTSSSSLQVSGGTGKRSPSAKKSSQEPASGSSQKRNADEAILEPITHREKRPRPLAAVPPSDIIASGREKSLPPTLVVKCSWPNAAKETVEPKMYDACKNSFGVAQSLGSFVACVRENQPMCNSIFLPPAGEDITKYYWPIFKSEKQQRVPKAVDCRTLWITTLANEGQNLDECSSALDLCECILHSMLGWLSAYQHGFLHRDISIGNLLKLVVPVSLGAFNAVEFIKREVPPEEPKKQDKTSLSNKKTLNSTDSKRTEYQELLTIAHDLDAALGQLGLRAEFKAAIIDGDMAAYIPTYFDSSHDKGVFSGTIEFMSLQLLDAMERNEPCLHTPLDDLWSFFWTALWATLNNHHYPGQTDREKRWRRQLCNGSAFREKVAVDIERDLLIEEEEQYSRVLRHMAPLLRGWYDSLRKVEPKWLLELRRKGDAKPEEMRLLFHKYAYSGVLNFVRVFSEHVQTLRNTSV